MNILTAAIYYLLPKKQHKNKKLYIQIKKLEEGGDSGEQFRNT